MGPHQGPSSQFLGISRESRLETEPLGILGFWGHFRNSERVWDFWGCGEGTMEVLGCPEHPNKTQGEFSRAQSLFSLGNGAAGSPPHLPRPGRFYWNLAKKKKSVFWPVMAEKEGGNPFQGGCPRPEPPDIPWERNSSWDQIRGAQRIHGGATGRPRVTFPTQFPIFMCSGSGFPAPGSRLQPSKKSGGA